MAHKSLVGDEVVFEAGWLRAQAFTFEMTTPRGYALIVKKRDLPEI